MSYTHVQAPQVMNLGSRTYHFRGPVNLRSCPFEPSGLAMPQLAAIATFIGKVVTVEATTTSGQVVSTFCGETTKEHNGKSEGHLTYQALPEGVYNVGLSIIPRSPTLPLPPPRLEIQFSPISATHQGPFDRCCFQFEGSPFGRVKESDKGQGTWKSVVVMERPED